MPPSGKKSHDKDSEEDEKKLFKLIIRRLPSGFTLEELMEQIEPLDDTTKVWLRKAPKSTDVWSFACAYISFEDLDKAYQFSRKFNGYVFVDKQGNESAAIVEMAMHQQVPETFMENSKKNDRRVGTLEQRSEYKKFLNEYNNVILHKVTNFDALIREVEEKEKRLEKGTVETPLVKALLHQAFEKERKRIARLEKHKPSLLQKTDDDTKKKVGGSRDDKKPRRKDENFKKPNEEKKKTEKPKQGNEASKSDAPPKEKKKRPEKPKRTDEPRNDDDTKRFDDSTRPAANGFSGRRPNNGPRPRNGPKEYAEFGNVKPKLLSRNPKSEDGVSESSKNNDAPTNQAANDMKKFVEKFDNVNLLTRQSNGDKNLNNDKNRRPAQRPERQIYRPPKNRDKKEKTPRTDNKEVEVAET